MKVVFRADASPTLGVGHVMRCISLARLLVSKGASIRFVCFPLPNAIRDNILEIGCELKEIDDGHFVSVGGAERQSLDQSSVWTLNRQMQDAKNTLNLIADGNWDWIVVDHYSISDGWEGLIKEKVKNLLVIDDLANRKHNCDVLLDQTLGRAESDYKPYVSQGAELLVGAKYAMLRPEFAELRSYSLNRRSKSNSKKMLISLGGGDFENVTAKILDTLSSLSYIDSWKITVILGAASPWVREIEKLIKQRKLKIELIVNCSNVAKIMSDSDFAIGAAGSSSWERCCLGLPTILIKLAPNQADVMEGLEKTGAVIPIYSIEKISSELPRIMSSLNSNLIDVHAMSVNASEVTDGNGCFKVAGVMERLN